MAYEVLKDEYYTSGLGPLGPSPLGIRYDPVTGDYELKAKSALGYDIGIGLAIFYENGSYTSDAIRDPKLFVDGDPNKPTALAQQLSVDMRKKVYAAYQAKGGNAAGIVVNASARPENQNSPAGVNNNFPGTNAGIASAVPGLSTPPGQGNIFDPGLGNLTNLDFKSNNEKDIFKDEGLLLYPIDILKEQQDTLQITMYRYKAPLEGVFSGKLDSKTIFPNGLQRNSALKERIATTVLPIPSGIQDNNAISWGDDSMNSQTASAAAFVSKNKGLVLGQQAVVGAGGAASQAFGVQVPVQTANNIALLTQSGALNSPLLSASVISLILKNAQIELPPETILARGAGIVPNSNLELLFQGPTLRSFGFTWRMSPRSALEARNVKRIIRMFKQGSAPRKTYSQSGAGAASFFLGTPNVFKLSYKTGNKEISGLNKFKICALVNMNVIYAPDGQWAAYAEGQPVSVQMTLNFQEIEPVYENDYQSTILDNLKDKDNSIVNDDDVGY